MKETEIKDHLATTSREEYAETKIKSLFTFKNLSEKSEIISIWLKFPRVNFHESFQNTET